MFTHPDEQCSDGYSGILCLVCATDYVKVGDECKECPGGASFEAALVPLLVLCGLLYCFVVIVLVRTSGAASGESDDTNDNVVQRMKRLKKVNKMFGQAKILMSLLQIVASMPFVLTGVQFSPFFKGMANAFGVFNLDVLALSSALLKCQYSVRFFDRVIIHLMLPVCCLLSISPNVYRF